ncbi:TTL-domain-containing protein [Ophiobolus disseminans]|uniref:TTL-domain-containing protein n=1 Tax=Ophiobolus disseminans TaxID=1469910 RepID=A0A6A7A7D2_9PLEO|nr:TTL-domain-containing protein [Ophiobolus disseminans]
MASDKIDEKIYALIDYEDQYVQPLIVSALKKRLPPATFELITTISELPSPSSRLLQWVQYESIDFDHFMEHPSTCIANAYVIRKALIRKHYLSTTIANWITKYPESLLKKHVKSSVEFEVDYAEFLDDALVEAWDLKESWARNEEKDEKEREWWILKPGMSERGQGIRLFSSEEELTAIFEEWDPPSDDDEDEDARSDAASTSSKPDAIMTSQLRHFIAQPYIHPPLLLSPPSTSPTPLRKFHIRTYVLATGALQVYVHRPMLALFAARPYLPPWDAGLRDDRAEAMRAHLTNTCLQDGAEREGSVGLFWDLPDVIPTQLNSTITPTAAHDWKSTIFKQICATTGETFEAAARGMSVHFQALPNAFEIFGLDFMVSVEEDGGLGCWLLEVNAFPDFRQTGGELRGVVEGLFEGVVERVCGGRWGVGMGGEEEDGLERAQNHGHITADQKSLLASIIKTNIMQCRAAITSSWKVRSTITYESCEIRDRDKKAYAQARRKVLEAKQSLNKLVDMVNAMGNAKAADQLRDVLSIEEERYELSRKETERLTQDWIRRDTVAEDRYNNEYRVHWEPASEHCSHGRDRRGRY